MERKDGTTTNYKKEKQPLRNQAEQSARLVDTLALSASGSHLFYWSPLKSMVVH